MNKTRYFPMNSAEVLDVTFDIYKRTFWMQVLLSIIIGIATMVIMGVVIFGGSVITVIATLSQSLAVMIVAMVIFFVVALIVALAIVAAPSAGCQSLSRQAFYGEKVDLSRALADTFKSFMRVASVSIAEGAVYMPIAAALLVPLVVLLGMEGSFGYYGLLDALNDMTGVLAGLTGYALIVMAVFMVASNFFILSIPIAVFEKRGFFRALSRSAALIKNDFWKILGLRIIFTVIINVVSYAVTMLFGTGVSLSGMLSEFSGSPTDIVTMYSTLGGQYAVAALLNTVLQPFSGILVAVFYFNQRIKKEGLDIEIGLSQIENELNAARAAEQAAARFARLSERSDINGNL